MHYYKTTGGIIAAAKPIDAEKITEEEFTALKSSIKVPVWTDEMQKLFERSRPLTEQEVSRMLITQQVNTLDVDDNTALRMMEFYPAWASETAYSIGYKVKRNGKLWRCRQDHTAQVGWEPGSDGTESLWEQVNETNAGTQDDPIPYDGNMALEEGLYYHQDYVIYLCTRNTDIPVYAALSELVGLYVEVAV